MLHKGILLPPLCPLGFPEILTVADTRNLILKGWVALKELDVSCHNPETIVCTTCPYYGSFPYLYLYPL